MAAKAILVLCAQALFIQSALSQCTSRAAVDASGMTSPFGLPGSLAGPGFAGLAYDRLPARAFDGLAYGGCAGRGLAYDGFYSPAMEFTATSGGALPVSSSSPMAPVGISIVSDNVYEGALSVAGELPFVGTTGLEGILATAGSGAINHACGNGINAMSALSGTSSPASVATMSGPYDGIYAPALAGTAIGANALAYDRLMAPGFTAPVMAYDAMPYADAAWAGRGLACNGLAYNSPVDAIEITPTSGGALPVSSASVAAPTGIAVASDNAYEGALAVVGELPFVGTVGMEGVVPSAGAGAVNHACGNGRNAMISETAAFGPAGTYGMTGMNPAAGFAPGAFGPGFRASGLGYRGDWAGRGCGCAL